MNSEAQRIAIGEICGFTLDQWKDMLKEKGIIGYRRNNLYYSVLPDYLNDLNAMHEAEMILKLQTDKNNDGMYYEFCEQLEQISGHWECSSATASQRAEAFLKTLGKWTD